MGFVLLALHQIQAEDRSHIEGILAPVIGRGHTLKQTEDYMRQVEKDLGQVTLTKAKLNSGNLLF